MSLGVGVTFCEGRISAPLQVYLVITGSEEVKGKGKVVRACSGFISIPKGSLDTAGDQGGMDGQVAHHSTEARCPSHGRWAGKMCKALCKDYIAEKFFFLTPAISFHAEWIWLVRHFLLFLLFTHSARRERKWLTGSLKLGRKLCHLA